MKYVAKDMGDAAEVNAGDGNQLAELAKLLSLALVLIVCLYLITVYLAEYFISGVSIEQEKQWFGHGNVFVDRQSGGRDSEEKLAKANSILANLIQSRDVPDLNYRLIALDSDEINAFAFPGGTIGLTTGLLDELNSEKALAFVIGHELGHFKHRHHLKGFSKALGLGVVFSIIFGGDSELAITQNIIAFLEARHSQQQEKDSDAFGASVVMQAYGNLEGIDGFFQLVKEKEASFASFLSTHPTSQSRIKHLNRLAEELDVINARGEK
ncbi:M48 family metallopeptidase [Aliikangiella coralliicola]|nr:M48 family metallopeptidase [Aliikangiella coralliicola]